MKRPASRSAHGRQRGVATLVVVMVLFFIISLVAAYTNRNLIFEQRTSVNQYRATQALEAADAGLEWTIAMLNVGRIGAACTHSTVSTDKSFRQRYVSTDPATRNLSPVSTALRAGCVWNGTGWQCSCPTTAGPPVLTPPTGAGIFPAFRVRFEPVLPAQPGVVRVLVAACTRLDDDCLRDNNQGLAGEGRVTVSSLVAITGNLASPPMAALVARDDVDLGSTLPLAVYNTHPAGNGIAIQAGGTVVTPGMVLRGLPGSPAGQSVKGGDTALQLPALLPFSEEQRMFAAPFNMLPETFRQQPAAVELACGGGSCSAADVRSAIAQNPGRPLWINGNLTIDSVGDIGTPIDPALLIVGGNLSFPTSGVTLYGLAYMRTPDWAVSGSGRIVGGVIAQGRLSAQAGSTTAPTIVFDPDVLSRLRAGVGSMVRVPGSWKDFQ